MAVELKVPEVGESVTEVTIGEWLKKEGDAVERDEVICMIETDKVTVELPAPVAGVLSKITVKDGESANVGDVIGAIDEGASASADSGSSGGGKAGGEERTSKQAEPPPPPSSSSQQQESRSSGSGEQRVMPAAQRAAHDAGVDVSKVEGSGPGGRVLKEDVQKAAGSSQQKDESSAPKREAKAAPPAPRATGGSREQEAVPMSRMRQRIAERLVQSQQQAALLTTFNEVDMSEVIELRNQYKDSFADKYGIKLGFMSFFVKAAIEALKEIPEVNAEVGDKEIIYRNYFDIGVAVGGGKGLVVPVLRNAECMSFADVELTISDFAKRARDNQLKLDELQGGTFTISNGGVYGSLMSTPIINPPQSGILGLHAIQERPVAVDGQVVIRPMMYVALTYDHRIIDGREAVTFLKRIKECVENPSRILLEI